MPTQELTEVQQIVQELCLMNNKFMNKVFENNIPAAELLLRIILKNDKIKVKEVKVQNFIQNLYGHSAQMDILAQDEAGVYFNVEVQRSDEGAPAKRAQKAVAKAEREKNKELVIKLSCKGMSVEEIANILDITEAQVRELAEKRSA